MGLQCFQSTPGWLFQCCQSSLSLLRPTLFLLLPSLSLQLIAK
nr:MAG TPA: hypothetical protein [Caudoviricetes sp.]